MEEIDDPFEPSSSSSRDHHEKVEAFDLLEESWFFNNSLNTTSTSLSRCFSDLCPFEDESNHSSMDELNQQRLDQNLFQRPTQLPTCVGREEGIEEKQSESRRTKLSGQSTHRSLLRTPSLPPRLGREEQEIVEDKESDPPMSKSYTRQASPNLSRHEVL